MADAPQAPKAPKVKAPEKSSYKAVKTVIWSAKPEDKNITILSGESCTGISDAVCEKLVKLGLVVKG